MDTAYGSSDPFANCFWPEVVPSDTHTVLYELPLLHDGKPPRPYKSRNGWKWDQKHVRLPCAPESQYPVQKSDGTSEVVNRWELIETALLGREIKNSHELELAILSYNSKYAKSWSFRGLHAFFEHELDDGDAELFFSNLLPKVIQLALQLPTLIPSSIPLLKHGQNHSLSFTQQQIACLVANAFLCTFPRRNTQKYNSEYKHFPDINFNRLLHCTEPTAMEKLKCLCHYFRRVTTGPPPIGVVTFRRRSLPPKCIPSFSESGAPLAQCLLVVRSTGTIESDGRGLLQVDFANKMIGGGVLGQGCVQEEIRFMICPELLITRLFTEVLRPDEALFIVGAEQFSLYTGYASSFEWAGNYTDPTPLDGNQRRQCQIVAIDALPFRDARHQYRPELMLRELTKAHVGYARLQQQQRVAPGVASGNWGCGAFNGDAHLKSLLQLMVCAVAERPLVYFTFGDRQLVADLEGVYKVLVEEKVTVGELWKVLLKFGKEKEADGGELFGFVGREVKRLRKGNVLGNWFGASSSKSVPKLTAPKQGELMTSLKQFLAGEGGSGVGRVNEGQKMEEVAFVRDYSDTDDEMPPPEQMKKKKLTSPVENGGREKMARMSLAECLDSYFVKGTSNSGGGGGGKGSGEMGKDCKKSVDSNCTAVNEEVDKNREEEVEIERTPIEDPVEDCETVLEKQSGEAEQQPKYDDVIVQIDEDGGEYIDASPPPLGAEQSPKDSHYTGRQTKLLDFFKLRNVKK